MSQRSYCMYDFRANLPANPGLVLWDPEYTGLPCGEDQRITEEEFRQRCHQDGYTPVGVDNFRPERLCAARGTPDSMGAAGMMCTPNWSQTPWCDR